MESSFLSRYPDVREEIEQLARIRAGDDLEPIFEPEVPDFEGFEEFQVKVNPLLWELEGESEFLMIHQTQTVGLCRFFK